MCLTIEKSKNKFNIWGFKLVFERFIEANVWAKNNNKSGFSILNNNLSLCKMIKPLWDGCVSSNDDKILNYLEKPKQLIYLGLVKVEDIFSLNEKVQEIEKSNN